MSSDDTTTPQNDESLVLPELMRAHYDEICRMNGERTRAEIEYGRLKKETHDAKKYLDEVSDELSDLIAAGPTKPSPQKTLPFDDAEPADWKSTPIGKVISLTDKQAEKLDSIGIHTVGDFEDLRAGKLKEYSAGLTDVKGVGEKTIDKWEDEVLEWLAVNARQPEQDESEDDAE